MLEISKKMVTYYFNIQMCMINFIETEWRIEATHRPNEIYKNILGEKESVRQKKRNNQMKQRKNGRKHEEYNNNK